MNERVELTPIDVQALLAKGKAVLVDVREPHEFAVMHIEGAVNVPLGELDEGRLAIATGGKSAVVMCRSGMRSAQACARISAKNVVMLAGGMTAWAAAGLPVWRAPSRGWWKDLPVERRVQVVIGGLAVVFSLLALVANPWFALGTLLLGGGLLNAGLSGWCGLGKLMLWLDR